MAKWPKSSCSDRAIFYIWLHARRQGGKIMTYYAIALIILGLLAIAGIIYVQGILHLSVYTFD